MSKWLISPYKLNQNIFLITSKFNSLVFIYVTLWMGDLRAFFRETV